MLTAATILVAILAAGLLREFQAASLVLFIAAFYMATKITLKDLEHFWGWFFVLAAAGVIAAFVGVG